MKSVLISIQPKWCELIASGKKTVEVRKTMPKLEPPFKCYIYCTHSKNGVAYCKGNEILNGKVIGEFVCDCYDGYWFTENDTDIAEFEDVQLSCVPVDELLEYANGKCLYFWNISDLVIYDEPKPLTDFAVRECLWHNIRNNGCVDASGEKCYDCRLKRPPQSWCYVEER